MKVFRLTMIVDGKELAYVLSDEKALNDIVGQINEGGYSLLQLNEGAKTTFINKKAISLVQVSVEEAELRKSNPDELQKTNLDENQTE